jgi:phosphopantothenoylcysteine decarboxylase/phosphopantothenate--cysteine ligase
LADQRRILITAGPTHEPIDAVRYLANRSSGRLGICLAAAARDAGWDVTLLLGPTPLPPPAGVRTERFQTTADLAALLDRYAPACDVLVMAAAVADYRPKAAAAHKLPRTGEKLVLELEPTPDLIRTCAAGKQPGQRLIGFALEERGVLAARAMEKLAQKGLDAIVANPLETMNADQINATVYTADGPVVAPQAGRAVPKDEFARWLIAWITATMS